MQDHPTAQHLRMDAQSERIARLDGLLAQLQDQLLDLQAAWAEERKQRLALEARVARLEST